MDFRKNVSRVNILKESIINLDYYYYNNLLYVIYLLDNKIRILSYDIHKYNIINKLELDNFISGCIDKNNNKFYIMNKISEIFSIDFDLTNNNFNIYGYEYIEIYNNIKELKYTLYIINNKLYLCYVKHREFLIHDFEDNITYNKSVNNTFNSSFYQVNNDIYLNVNNVLHIFNTQTKIFSSINNNENNISHNYITKISKDCAIVSNKLYDYKNNTITVLDSEPDYYYEFMYYATIESNNIIDNLYIYDKYILVLTYGTISKIDNNNNFVLTNGINKFDIPKNVLYKRSIFFKNMLDDMFELDKHYLNNPLISENDLFSHINNNIEINFQFFDSLPIYFKYITTNVVDIEDFDKLYELCLFIEDIDVEHLSNYIVDISSKYPVDEKEWIMNLNNVQLFYSNNMIKQYYQLMNNLCPYDNNSSNEFLTYLKKIQTNYDSFNFYIDSLEYVVGHKYNIHSYNF